MVPASPFQPEDYMTIVIIASLPSADGAWINAQNIAVAGGYNI
jgi:hypothetical protein